MSFFERFEYSISAIRRKMVQLSKTLIGKSSSSTSLDDKKKILKNPNIYIGSVKPVTEKLWIWDGKEKIDVQKIKFVPGLYKIFDEVLMFFLERKKVDDEVTTIWIEAKTEDSKITIRCNGEGLSCNSIGNLENIFNQFVLHVDKESEFDADYGLPLANVFSKSFTVRTISLKHRRKMEQTWENNMSKTSRLKSETCAVFDRFDCCTEVKFEPDWKKFGIDKITPDMFSVFRHRALEVAATMTKKIKIHFNNASIQIARFDPFVELFFRDSSDFLYDNQGDWKVAVSFSEKGFQHVSYVNSVHTIDGGTHVDHVAKIISKAVCKKLKDENCGALDIKLTESDLRNFMWIFLSCTIKDATFDSPTREFMDLNTGNFSSLYAPSSKFLTGIIDCILDSSNKINKKHNKGIPLTTVEARKSKVAKMKIKTTKRKSGSSDESSTLSFGESKSRSNKTLKANTTKRSLVSDKTATSVKIFKNNTPPLNIYEEETTVNEGNTNSAASSSIYRGLTFSSDEENEGEKAGVNDENAIPNAKRHRASPRSPSRSPSPLYSRDYNTWSRAPLTQNRSKWVNKYAFSPDISSVSNYSRNSPMSSDQEGMMPTGLENLGNSCYMNTIMQCINHTNDLVDYFVSGEYKDHLNTNGTTKGKFTEKIAEAIQDMNKDRFCVELSAVKKILGKHYHPFNNFRQQDSHEFLTYLLTWMHEDLNQKLMEEDTDEDKSIDLGSDDSFISIDDGTTADLAWQKYLRSNCSKISELFCGQQKSSVRCTICSHTSVSFETFFFLSVPIPVKQLDIDDYASEYFAEKITLEACIDLYTMEEDISDQVMCSKCQVKTLATKKIEIWKFPKYLIIHLNRFYIDGKSWRKRESKVNFPLDNLVLTPASGTENEKTYQLYGVSNHMGSMSSGHYTAYCRKNKKWTELSDTSVSNIHQSRVCTSDGYILFYQSSS